LFVSDAKLAETAIACIKKRRFEVVYKDKNREEQCYRYACYVYADETLV